MTFIIILMATMFIIAITFITFMGISLIVDIEESIVDKIMVGCLLIELILGITLTIYGAVFYLT